MPKFARNLGMVMVVIALGSVLPDVDHITSGGRAWGHMAVIPGAILLVLAVTYLCRLFKSWVLGRAKCIHLYYLCLLAEL